MNFTSATALRRAPTEYTSKQEETRPPTENRGFDVEQMAAVRKTILEIAKSLMCFHNHLHNKRVPKVIEPNTVPPQLWVEENLLDNSFGQVGHTPKDLPKRMKKMYAFNEYQIIEKTKKELQTKWLELQKAKNFPSMKTLALKRISLNEREQAFYKTVLEGLSNAFFPEEDTSKDVEEALKPMGLDKTLNHLSRIENIDKKNINAHMFTHKFPIVIKAALKVSREYSKWIYAKYPHALHKESWTKEKVMGIADVKI